MMVKSHGIDHHHLQVTKSPVGEYGQDPLGTDDQSDQEKENQT